MAIGAGIAIFRDLGLLPFNTFTVNALQFGSAIEMLLLAFALADRFNVLRLEKIKAQDDALKAQLHLVEHLQSHERILEARVTKICEKLAALGLPHELSAFGCVTVSIGVASMVPDKALTPDVLVKYADEALYRAKEQGRNRAVLG